jgi:hypothetical protein
MTHRLGACNAGWYGANLLLIANENADVADPPPMRWVAGTLKLAGEGK